MAISHIPRSVGHNFLPEYQISAIPYTRDGVINTYDNDSPLTINNNTVYVVEFPKITQWIQFKAAASLTVYFSSKDAEAGSNGMTLGTNRTYPLNIRCVNLYFNDADDGKRLEILAGLTTIDRSEFTSVVETFLEGQP
tara:strand:+ start:264 stop:677 length:414 start_codon:yes stop_codon:yes gene_type:complete